MTALLTEGRAPVPGWPARLDGGWTAARLEAGGLVLPGRPGGLAVGPDKVVVVSEGASGTIWRFSSDGVDLVRAPLEDAPGGVGRKLPAPAGLALGPDGTLVVADADGHRVWAVAPTGEWSVLAGSCYGWCDGPASEALFRFPSGVALAPDGTCYVADTGNDRIRTITPDGRVATLAGSIYDHGDGRGEAARFRRPTAVVVDDEGTCYVADTGNNAIRRITPDGTVTTLAGLPPGGDADGVGPEAGLRWPTGLALANDGHLWVADHGNGALRRLGCDGACTTRWRLPAGQWPVAVATLPDDAVLVLASSYDEARHPQMVLVTVEEST